MGQRSCCEQTVEKFQTAYTMVGWQREMSLAKKLCHSWAVCCA
jgi:hypothetical protein